MNRQIESKLSIQNDFKNLFKQQVKQEKGYGEKKIIIPLIVWYLELHLSKQVQFCMSI